MFADDLKIFNQVNNDTVTSLQLDLNNLTVWCENNAMSLNLEKCYVLNFSHKLNKSTPCYSISNSVLREVDNIKDLGVVLDTKLTFTKHYDFIVAKANKMLGCIKRWTSDFANVRILLLLFNAFVRSVLEYCAVIWSPFYNIHILRIENVQGKFLKYVDFKLRSSNVIVPFNQLCDYLGLIPLQKRRIHLQLCFLYKIVNNFVDSGEILSQILFATPHYSTRSQSLFKFNCFKTNYCLHSSLQRLLWLGGLCRTEVDFTGVSFKVFKSQLRNLF